MVLNAILMKGGKLETDAHREERHREKMILYG
jgi:hypothetical protein